jgi:hypothetical protein
MITSGSWRKMARRAVAKVRSIAALTGSGRCRAARTRRVLDRQHVGGGGFQGLQRGVQGGRLARAGGAGDQHDAVRILHELLEAAQYAAAHAQRFEGELRFALVEQAQHGALAVGRGQGRHAHVDRPAADAQRNAAVLRQALLGDVELGHDLQARDQRRVQRLVRLHDLAQRAVDTEANRRAALVGLDVDVARAVFRRLCQQRVEHANDRRSLRLEQVFDGRQLCISARSTALRLTDHRRSARFAPA